MKKLIFRHLVDFRISQVFLELLTYLKRTQSEKYYNIIVQDKPLLPLSLFPNCTELYVLFDYQCNVIMKAFTFISIGFSFVFRCKNNHKNIFDRISFVSCNCPFDLSGFSGCWTCFPSEAAAYVKSPPKHMFPFPTIISIENNSFFSSNSRPSAQPGLKMKTGCKSEPLRIRIYPENCESAPKSRSPNCSF